MNVQREVRFAAKAGALRTASFQNVEHIVVPVVAMVEGVVWAVNAPAPELVLFEEISRCPKGWNGRPIVGGHPLVNGAYVSANEPQVLENEILGHIFNAKAENNRLLCEAWINPSLASRPGTIGERLLQRIEAIREGNEDDVIEVSVGNFMALEQKQGSYNGQPYSGIWRDIVPDHLAFLSEGDEGACNDAMGCGAPKNSQKHLDRIHIVTSKGVLPARDMTHIQVRMSVMRHNDPLKEATTVSDEKKEEEKPPKKSFRQKMSSVISALMGEEDMSDRALRDALDTTLRATVPGYQWIEEVIPGKNTVVVMTMPGRDMMQVMFTYSIDANGVASLEGEGTPVQEVRSFEPIVATTKIDENTTKIEENTRVKEQLKSEKPVEQPPTIATASCGCAKGEENMDKAQRIKALIEAGTFKESDRPVLEAATESALTMFETTKAVVPPKAETSVSVDSYLADAPEAIKADVAELQSVATARRKTAMEHMTRLRTNGRHDFTDAEIALRSTRELERFVKMMGENVSFVGAAGITVTPPPTEVEKYTAPAPPDFVAAMQKKK